MWVTDESIGKVQGVDTGNVSVEVTQETVLNSVQVNQIVRIQSSRTGEHIIGLVTKIVRKSLASVEANEKEVENSVLVSLVGTLSEREGEKTNVFRRTLRTVPSVNAACYLVEGDDLTKFMNAITTQDQQPLELGKYAVSTDSDAKIDGNKFFQRHAVIVGGTGSGKSWTVANILGQAADLRDVNCMVFDLHGEYRPLEKLPNTHLLKIAGPTDEPGQGIVFLPYWLLSYEEMEDFLLDRSDSNAPNQSRALLDGIIDLKRQWAREIVGSDVSEDFTIDSPIPYRLSDLLGRLDALDKEMVQGQRGEKQGPLHGRLTRFVQRLKSKSADRRLNLIFCRSQELLTEGWLASLLKSLLDFGNKAGMKIVDFSEVPSDILPLVMGLLVRLVFSVQQRTEGEARHPIAMFCDEAHLYIPASTTRSLEVRGLQNFERVAKEGRKYGVALVIISQRPADVSKTVLSQCGNFIAMRLSNADDQNVIRRLFPDNLGDFAALLPILDIGEALVVGDASLLPSRVQLNEPKIRPNSATVNIWDEWKGSEQAGSKSRDIEQIVRDLRS